MSPTRSAREISDQITNTATVHIRLVGPDSRKWCLQKSLLRHHSSYFRAVLSPSTLDETINDLETLSPYPSLSLSPSTVTPFDLFIQWIYTGTIDDAASLHSDEEEEDGEGEEGEIYEQLDTYIRLFCLCAVSYLDVPALAALALTRMGELYQLCFQRRQQQGRQQRKRGEKESAFRFFTAQHVEFIYTHTLPFSPLRDIALRASVFDFLNSDSSSYSNSSFSAAGTVTATVTATVETTNVHNNDEDGGEKSHQGGENDKDEEKDQHHRHRPSYEYMTRSVNFANDLLHAIRAHHILVLSSSSSVYKTKEELTYKHPFHPHSRPPSPPLAFTPHPHPHPHPPKTPLLTPSLHPLEPEQNISPLTPSPSQGKDNGGISIPIQGLLTPDATPTKPGIGTGTKKRVSEMVRKRSLGEWVRGEKEGLVFGGESLPPPTVVTVVATATGKSNGGNGDGVGGASASAGDKDKDKDKGYVQILDDDGTLLSKRIPESMAMGDVAVSSSSSSSSSSSTPGVVALALAEGASVEDDEEIL